jgi:mannose-6-phosphate isomerase-like protein (cupin superfamily)
MINFEDHIEDIRNKHHWWTKVDTSGYSWNDIIPLIDTHPEEHYDWNREKQRLGLNRFHARGSAPQFAKDTYQELEEFFIPKAPTKEKYEKGAPQITNIAFCGFGQYSGSYPRHKDSMDVFLIQVISECQITIGYNEEPRNADETRLMRPGDAVWIPRGTWHQLKPKTSRVTFSFGFESDKDCDPATFI